MQLAFSCLSAVFKHLQRALAADVRGVLSLTVRLRYHDLEYIRALAAQSLGLLFRYSNSCRKVTCRHLRNKVYWVCMSPYRSNMCQIRFIISACTSA